MAVHHTVNLTDSTGDTLRLEPRPDETEPWQLIGSSQIYASADDLRAFAHAILQLVGDA